jgi:exodeoxyribonuclease III
LRILLWNLLHGGGKRIPALVDAALRHEPDVCVLTESRATTVEHVTAMLAEHGLSHHLASDTPPRKNGVLVAGRTPLVRRAGPDGQIYQQRWVEADLPECGFQIVACHIPPKISIGVEQKAAFWSTLLGYAADAVDRPALIVGDLNTGAPYRDEHRATLYCADQFLQLEGLGWVDAWRRFHGPARKEWSWVFPRRRSYGYRLDHAFCTPPLAERLMACRYSHAERQARISDHSLMLIDLATPQLS